MRSVLDQIEDVLRSLGDKVLSVFRPREPREDEDFDFEGESKPRRRRSSWRLAGQIFAVLLAVGLTGIVAVALLAFSYYLRLDADLPDYAKLSNYEPPITTRVHAGDGALIAEYARERRLFAPFDTIPKSIVNAFLSAEDKDYYSHGGVDFQGILRAAVTNIDNFRHGRRLQGASTITQQVAKNFLLTNEVSLNRKIKEAMLSFRIEKAYSKDKILELYLNEIYLGAGSYGIAAAALNYFDKGLTELTLGETAFLASLPKAPNNYNPNNHKAAAIARRNWVLSRMAENGFITQDEERKAQAEDLVSKYRPMGAQFEEAKYFAEEVRREVVSLYGDQSLYDGGLSIRTSLDMRLQRAAIKTLRDGLVAYDQRHGWRGPVTRIGSGDGWQDRLKAVDAPQDIDPWEIAVVLSTSTDSAKIGLRNGKQGRISLDQMTWARKLINENTKGPEIKSVRDVVQPGDVIYVAPVPNAAPGNYALQQMPGVNGSLVAEDPHTGRVLALVGGFSYDASVFNRATQAMRQTGSAFKPFVYAAALDHGYTPSSIILDAPFVLDQGGDLGLWKPENYEEDFAGPSTLRFGVEHSRNAMTVRLAAAMGMDPVVEYAKRFGINDNMPPVLSMAIGSGETTLLRLTNAYAMIVNGGKKVEPTLIDRIQDRNGKTIFKHDKRVCPECSATYWANQPEPQLPDTREQVLDPATAYQIVSILQGVVERGTGSKVKEANRQLAGKTGTTNEEKDA